MIAVKKQQLLKIKKRDGRIVPFDQNRIVTAIFKAGQATGSFDKKEAERIADIVIVLLKKTVKIALPEVEQIQDIVEQCLMAASHYEAAKAYILYRKEHEELRRSKEALGIIDDIGLPLNSLKTLKSRHLRKDSNGNTSETPKQLFTRVARAVASVEKKYGASVAKVERYASDYYDLLANLLFLPGGSYLRNAGVGGPLSNCHVLAMPDDIAGIYETIKQSAVLTKNAGGGVGYNFSHIRPSGDYIKSSGGLSTGPISFMRVVDTSNIVIGMGGYGKGASMGVLNINHPDILDFINCKRGGRELTSFNISVGVTDKFMTTVINDREFDLVNPRDGKKVKSIRAALLFDLIGNLAHATGDPGILFLDTANKANTLPGLGPMESTNICGEVWLHPNDVCNLGSINLALFVKNGLVDEKRLVQTVQLATRFMDNGVDLSTYPVQAVEQTSKANRRMGLGVMGWADMLIQLGIPYNSEKAITKAEEVMKLINDTAFETSCELAKERGVFPNYDLSIYKKKKIKIRNCARTCIAPTGSISMVADCSSGIEPIFALAFRKNVVDAQGVFYINKYFEATARANKLPDDVVKQVAETGSLQNVKGVSKNIKDIFVIAHEISPEFHVRMQAAFQKYVDNSISKTINLPKTATEDEVKKIYMLAWKLGCKGITIYRDGCRDMQILSAGDKAVSNDTQVIQSKKNIVPLSDRVYEFS